MRKRIASLINNNPLLVWLLVWLVSILISTQFEVLFGPIGIDRDYQRQITLGIFTSGLLGLILWFATFTVQKEIDYRHNKILLANFYNNQLILDLKDLFDHDFFEWNFTDDYRFYFGNSYTNRLFLIYMKHFDRLAEFERDGLVELLNEFYIITRHAYTEAEKLDELIDKKVREISIGNSDGTTNPQIVQTNFWFTRAKLFKENITDEEILVGILKDVPYHHRSVITHAEGVYLRLKNDPEIEPLLERVRNYINDDLKRIERLIENYPGIKT